MWQCHSLDLFDKISVFCHMCRCVSVILYISNSSIATTILSPIDKMSRLIVIIMRIENYDDRVNKNVRTNNIPTQLPIFRLLCWRICENQKEKEEYNFFIIFIRFKFKRDYLHWNETCFIFCIHRIFVPFANQLWSICNYENNTLHSNWC